MKKENPKRKNWKRTSLHGFDPSCTDPNLHSRYMKYLSKTVKCDDGTKRLVFNTMLSTFTPNPLNLFIKGDSSIGKTHNVKQNLEFFSEDMKREHIWVLGGMSPKALIHSDKSILKDARGSIIDLAEKPTTRKPRRRKNESEDAYAFRLQQWETERLAWAESIRDSYYEVNLNGKLLVFLEPPQIETFNILRPILSHDVKEISYKITEKTSSGQLRATHIKIKGWPATIFCTSEEKILKDLATRSFCATPETSDKKLKSALSVLAEKRVNPWKFERDDEWVQLESYLRWWSRAVSEYHCLVPYARELMDVFPLYAPRVMRDFDHFLTLIEVSALFHLAQRPFLKIGNEKFILTTFADFEIIMGILPSFEETTISGLQANIIGMFHKVIVPLAEEVGAFDYSQLTDAYNLIFKEKRSSKTLYKWVKLLSDIGWVTTYEHPEDRRKNLIKIIKNSGITLYSSLRRLPQLFSEKTLENMLNEVKNYSPREVTLYGSIIEKNEVSVNDIYREHFWGEYFLSENKPELGSKSEKKPIDILREQSGTSLSLDEMLQPSVCFSCRKSINKANNESHTHYRGELVCMPCFRKLKAQEKSLEEP